MNLADILNLFRQGESSAKSHIRNLIEMALVDGNLDLIEYDLLRKIALSNHISEEELRQIHENPKRIQFVLPEDPRERFRQFYDLVHMMTIDQTDQEEEIQLCYFFAQKFGYPKEHIHSLVNLTRDCVKFKQSPSETFERVAWMLP
jgi:uncharacterized tellurite resistance protein B-like protein